MADARPCTQGDPEDWFPHPSEKVRIRLAQAGCKKCPMVEWWTCLEDAMEEEGQKPAGSRFGIRAGMTEKQRARLARQRAKK